MKILKILFLGMLLSLCGQLYATEIEGQAVGGGEGQTVMHELPADSLPDTNSSIPDKLGDRPAAEYQGCCKYCSAGKPCGDSCISRDKTCRVGRGCAC